MALALAAAFAGGFLLFVDRAQRFDDDAVEGSDGIVVLTGGVERIAAGAQLVTQKRGQRLLITGVNEKATRDDMLAQHPQLRAIDQCCLDLGYRAQNTAGNALEAREWAQSNGYHSLTLVTNAAHMPRAIAEFSHAMPDVAMRPYAAGWRRQDLAAWWADPALSRTLAFEYAKYVFARLRIALEPEAGRWLPHALRAGEPQDRANRR